MKETFDSPALVEQSPAPAPVTPSEPSTPSTPITEAKATDIEAAAGATGEVITDTLPTDAVMREKRAAKVAKLKAVIDGKQIETKDSESESPESKAEGKTPSTTSKSGKEKVSDDKREELMTRAITAGLSREEAGELGTSLSRTLDLLERQVKSQGQTKESAKATEQTKEPAKVESQAKPENTPDKGAYKVGLSDDYDQEVRDELQKIADHNAKAVETAKQEMLDKFGPVIGQMQQERTSQAEREFDSYRASLGEKHSDLIGVGPIAEMDPNSTAFKNCMEWLRETERIQRNAVEDGKRPPSDKVCYERAMRALWGEQVEKTNAQETIRKLHDRKAQFTHPPTARRVEEPQDWKSRARRNMNEMLGKR